MNFSENGVRNRSLSVSATSTPLPGADVSVNSTPSVDSLNLSGINVTGVRGLSPKGSPRAPGNCVNFFFLKKKQ